MHFVEGNLSSVLPYRTENNSVFANCELYNWPLLLFLFSTLKAFLRASINIKKFFNTSGSHILG